MKKPSIFLFCAALAIPWTCAAQRFVGVTEPIHDLKLSVPVEGIVASVSVREGQRVQAGAELLRLDDRLQRYEAQRRKAILDDRAKLETARHNEAVLASMLETTRSLYQQTGSVSAEEVKRLEIQHANALGELRALEQDEIREAIELDIARRELERRALQAPRGGRVTMVGVSVGEWARPGEAIVRIVDPSRCYLVVNIDERFARLLKEGDQIPVYVTAGDQELERAGQVLVVSPVADPASGLVRVKIEFGNEDGEIWPGMPASIEFPDQGEPPFGAMPSGAPALP